MNARGKGDLNRLEVQLKDGVIPKWNYLLETVFLVLTVEVCLVFLFVCLLF